MYAYYIAKATENFGLPATRPIYQRAIESLPDSKTAEMCLRFANLEQKLGEIDRARASTYHSTEHRPGRPALTWHDVSLRSCFSVLRSPHRERVLGRLSQVRDPARFRGHLSRSKSVRYDDPAGRMADPSHNRSRCCGSSEPCRLRSTTKRATSLPVPPRRGQPLGSSKSLVARMPCLRSTRPLGNRPSYRTFHSLPFEGCERGR